MRYFLSPKVLKPRKARDPNSPNPKGPRSQVLLWSHGGYSLNFNSLLYKCMRVLPKFQVLATSVHRTLWGTFMHSGNRMIPQAFHVMFAVTLSMYAVLVTHYMMYDMQPKMCSTSTCTMQLQF